MRQYASRSRRPTSTPVRPSRLRTPPFTSSTNLFRHALRRTNRSTARPDRGVRRCFLHRRLAASWPVSVDGGPVPLITQLWRVRSHTSLRKSSATRAVRKRGFTPTPVTVGYLPDGHGRPEWCSHLACVLPTRGSSQSLATSSPLGIRPQLSRSNRNDRGAVMSPSADHRVRQPSRKQWSRHTHRTLG